jgi:hypothetical protein
MHKNNNVNKKYKSIPSPMLNGLLVAELIVLQPVQ